MGVARRKLHVGRRLGNGPPDALAELDDGVDVPGPVDIPAIGVVSDLLQLGLNPDNTIEVPPLSENSPAGWYRCSATSEELGPAVIPGHVNSAEPGSGVFFDPGALRPGDTITVVRADDTAAVFGVDRVANHPEDRFPRRRVRQHE